MDLASSDGNHLSLRIGGYQFPNAADLDVRFGWQVVIGSVTCGEGDWSFEDPALTSSESPLLSHWLRAVAGAPLDGSTLPSRLDFDEPNFAFDARATPTRITVSVWFNLDCQPLWHARPGARDPYVVEFQLTRSQVAAAADEWDSELAAIPGMGA